MESSHPRSAKSDAALSELVSSDISAATLRQVRSRKASVVMCRILDAAENEFMRFGFERASIDRMLADFGGSKATVFRHFPTKRALFEGVVRRTALRWEVAVHWKDIEAEDPREWLIEFASRVLSWFLSAEPMFLGHTAIAEGYAFPDLRDLFPELALQPIEAVIACKLRIWTEAGLLTVDDCSSLTTILMDCLFIGAVARKLFGGRREQNDFCTYDYIKKRVFLIFDSLACR